MRVRTAESGAQWKRGAHVCDDSSFTGPTGQCSSKTSCDDAKPCAGSSVLETGCHISSMRPTARERATVGANRWPSPMSDVAVRSDTSSLSDTITADDENGSANRLSSASRGSRSLSSDDTPSLVAVNRVGRGMVNAGRRGRSLAVADGTTNDSSRNRIVEKHVALKEAAVAPRRPHVATPFAFSFAAATVL